MKGPNMKTKINYRKELEAAWQTLKMWVDGTTTIDSWAELQHRRAVAYARRAK